MKAYVIPALFALQASAALDVIFEDQTFILGGQNFLNKECTTSCPRVDLSRVSQGLLWSNLVAVSTTPANDRTGNQIGLVGSLVNSDSFDFQLGYWIDPTAPVTATVDYDRSCEAKFQLQGLEFGCGANQNIGTKKKPVITNTYADCTLLVEGFNANGKRVGKEKFESTGNLIASTATYNEYTTQPFNTTAGGLAVVDIHKLVLTPKYKKGPGKFVGNLTFGIDEVKYNLYQEQNKTTSECAQLCSPPNFGTYSCNPEN